MLGLVTSLLAVTKCPIKKQLKVYSGLRPEGMQSTMVGEGGIVTRTSR